MHALNVLPDATAVAADHVAVIMLKVTNTTSNIVSIVLHDGLRVAWDGERGVVL